MNTTQPRKRSGWLPALLLIAALLSITWLALPGLQRSRSERSAQTVIATINQQDISYGQFQEEIQLQSVRQDLRNEGGQALNQAAVLNQMIANQMMLQAAEEAGVQVLEEDIQAAMDSIYANYGLTQESFLDVLASQDVSFEIFKGSIRNYLKILFFVEFQLLNGVPLEQRQSALAIWVTARFEEAEMDFNPAFLEHVNLGLTE